VITEAAEGPASDPDRTPAGARLATTGPGAAQLAQVTWRVAEPWTPTPGTPLLPPRATASGTLRRILETSLVLFGQRGYHAVSVRDITRSVGLHASSLYAHFASKAQLLTELIRIGHEEHRALLRLSLLEAGSDPADQLAALTRAHVGLHTTYPLLARLCNRELSALPDDSRAEVLAIRLDAERMFFEVIERGQRLGAFTDVEPMLAVAAIGAMGIRLAEWWHPDLGLRVETVADTYARFAVALVT